jgi:hypothetical protein
MPKSNRLAAGETKLCTSRTKIKMDSRLCGNQVKCEGLYSGFRRNDEQKDEEESKAPNPTLP